MKSEISLTNTSFNYLSYSSDFLNLVIHNINSSMCINILASEGFYVHNP